jgi:hypothetical protein
MGTDFIRHLCEKLQQCFFASGKNLSCLRTIGMASTKIGKVTDEASQFFILAIDQIAS